MLYILTGGIQTGKTRWLSRHIAHMEAEGVRVCGVISPGTWIDHGEDAGENRYEKTGIEAMLLPSREVIPFAQRVDLAEAAEAFEPDSQAGRAKLHWAISDDAIRKVNEHFNPLAKIEDPARRLLVVDEFGMLELKHSQGFSQAVALIERGATAAFPDALIVVREALLAIAKARFSAQAWRGMEIIRP